MVSSRTTIAVAVVRTSSPPEPPKRTGQKWSGFELSLYPPTRGRDDEVVSIVFSLPRGTRGEGGRPKAGRVGALPPKGSFQIRQGLPGNYFRFKIIRVCDWRRM